MKIYHYCKVCGSKLKYVKSYKGVCEGFHTHSAWCYAQHEYYCPECHTIWHWDCEYGWKQNFWVNPDSEEYISEERRLGFA